MSRDKLNNKWEARRIHNPAEAKTKDEALQAITKKGEAKDPDDMVKEKDDKVPGDEVVHQMKTGNFIRSRAMEMIAKSREKAELTQRMDIEQQHKADNHYDDYQTAGTNGEDHQEDLIDPSLHLVGQGLH